ncbi:ROK family protein [uncultured Dubosiella sp.]|uniref:ROK family protein n=1 Tax=uncultured Dubosiella sp. TaxID=1937011 RepID=UPI0020808115|nr:ROK family protein [uncultured Dubosiella sp.]GJM56928.1 hypothetical protein EROP_06210 [Erysipelotrichaceae bacterium OPF54]
MNQIENTRNLFYDRPSWTKNELAVRTSLSMAGITKHLSRLMELNYIAFDGTNDSTGGRPSKRYVLHSGRSHVLCIRLRKSITEHAVFEVVDLLNTPVLTRTFQKERLDPIFILDQAADLTSQDPKIDLIIVSFPGICSDGQIVIGDLKQFLGHDLKEEIRSRFAIECVIENDVNCACIGYCRLHGQNDAAFLYLPKNDPVGCGLVLNGRLYNGQHHFAGELRYLPFDHLSLPVFIDTLSCVIAPKIIAVYDETSSPLQKDAGTIPEPYRPVIDYVDRLDPYIAAGMYSIAVDTLKHRKLEKGTL